VRYNDSATRAALTSNTTTSTRLLHATQAEYANHLNIRDQKTKQTALTCREASRTMVSGGNATSDLAHTWAHPVNSSDIVDAAILADIKERVLQELSVSDAMGLLPGFAYSSTGASTGVSCNGTNDTQPYIVLAPNETCAGGSFNLPPEELCEHVASPHTHSFVVFQVGCVQSATCFTVKLTKTNNSSTVHANSLVTAIGPKGHELINSSFLLPRNEAYCEGRCNYCTHGEEMHAPCTCHGANVSDGNFCSDMARDAEQRSCLVTPTQMTAFGERPSGCEDVETLVQDESSGQWVTASGDEDCCEIGDSSLEAVDLSLGSLSWSDLGAGDTVDDSSAADEASVSLDATAVGYTSGVRYGGGGEQSPAVGESEGCRPCKYSSKMACTPPHSQENLPQPASCSYPTGCQPSTFSSLENFAQGLLAQGATHIADSCADEAMVMGSPSMCAKLDANLDGILRKALTDVRFKVAAQTLA